MSKESFRSLAPGIHLVIVGRSRKSRAFGYKSLYPRLQQRMRQIPVPGLQLRTGPDRARYFAAFGVHLEQAANFVPQGLYDGRSVRLVLHEFQLSIRPLAAETSNRQ